VTSTYNLSWSSPSLKETRKLLCQSLRETREKRHSLEPREQADGFSALSSTYLTIAGRGKAQLVNTFDLRWLPLTVRCLYRMLPLSNKVLSLIGYVGMTADQCDIRQSILRARSKFRLFVAFDLLEEAKKCIYFGLNKEVRDHTRALLYAGLADTKMQLGLPYSAKKSLQDAISWAEKAEQAEPRQASRVYKTCAGVVESILKMDDNAKLKEGLPTAETLKEKARDLALKTGAEDQSLKIEAQV
jgi:tetratricopeptide (TPR) repeat protein